MEQQTQRNGFLVLDPHDAVIFRSGLARDQAIERLVRDRASRISTHAMDVFSIDGRHFAVVARKSETEKAYLIHEIDDEDVLFDFVASVDFAYSVFNHFVSSPFEAMAVVDADARLRYFNPVHEKSLGLAHRESVGRPIADVVKNTGMVAVLKSGKSDVGHTMDINGRTIIVSRVPIFSEKKVVGALAQMMFKGPDQLHELSREVARLKSEVTFYQRELSVIRSRPYGLEQIVGESSPMRELKSQIARIAPLDVPVLLLGESGTGKELVANAIHSLSGRPDRQMVAINAAAMPSTLVESELFGYESGAFTGAERKGRKGKFELADRSTLFLDEIGDMPMEVQIKLLRVLQDGMFERVGGDRPRHSDFRLITATNRDLKKLLESEKFRLDLYYRISSVTLRIPPLRERLDDIPLLVENFVQAYSRRHQVSAKRVHRDVYAYLKDLPWPGNVRQLLHETEKAVIFCDTDTIRASDFSCDPTSPEPRREPDLQQQPEGAPPTLTTIENDAIRDALLRHRGNKSRVANELGISRSYLYKRLAVIAEAMSKPC